MSTCNTPRRMLCLLALTLVPSFADADQPAGGRITLVVSETAGIRRFGYPVSTVLDLPEPMKEGVHFRLLEGGKPIGAQFRPLSKPTVRLDFNASPGPLERREYVVEFGPDVAPGQEPKGGLTVETADDEFRVQHGKELEFAVPRNLLGLLRGVKTPKTDYLRPKSEGLLIRLKDGSERRIGGPDLTGRVVVRGPLSVVLRFQTKSDGDKAVSSVVEMDFPLSKSWVRVVWTVDDPRGEAAGLGADLGLHIDGEPTLIDFGAGSLVYAHLKRGQSAVLRQNGPAWETLVGPSGGRLLPYVVAARPLEGARAPGPQKAEGWAHAMDRERCTAVAVRDFAVCERGEISADADGRLRLWRHFALDGAAPPSGRKELVFWLHFVGMPVQVGAVTSPQAMLAPIIVEVRKER